MFQPPAKASIFLFSQGIRCGSFKSYLLFGSYVHHKMDPKHSSEMFEHLEKQQEILMEAYRTLSLELHNLQVEEEMLMHKFYEFMSTQGLVKKGKKREDLSNEDSLEKQADLCSKDSRTYQSQ